MAEHIQATYRVSVKALIRDEEGRILLNRENGRDEYSLPGGGIDHGETTELALKRELVEEIGLATDFKATLRTTIPFYTTFNDRWMIWIVFDVECNSNDIEVGTDSESIQWVKPDEIDESTLGGQLIKSVLQ